MTWRTKNIDGRGGIPMILLLVAEGEFLSDTSNGGKGGISVLVAEVGFMYDSSVGGRGGIPV